MFQTGSPEMVDFIRSIGFRMALVAVGVCCLAARPQCGVRAPGSPCTGRLIAIEPGGCSELPDPCGNHWADLATLAFTKAPAGLWFEVQRRPTGTTVHICAADTVERFVADDATIRIVENSGAVHDVDLQVSTSLLISAFVTAVPETVTALDTLQLTAHAQGGTRPYQYEWSIPCNEGGFVGSSSEQTARVYATCDNFFLTVTDAAGSAGHFIAFVPTYVGLSVTATPAVIDSGDASYLEATAIGGEMVRKRWWEPATGLDTPGALKTYAYPDTTTTYTVHVETRSGLVSSATTTVTVRE